MFNGWLVDFFDVDAWSEALIEALARGYDFHRLRQEAARRMSRSATTSGGSASPNR